MIGPARNTAVQIIDGLPIHAVPETFQIGDRDFCSCFAVKQEPRITIHMGSGIQHNIVFPANDPRKVRFPFLQQRDFPGDHVHPGDQSHALEGS